jgi:hypothetical protein
LFSGKCLSDLNAEEYQVQLKFQNVGKEPNPHLLSASWLRSLNKSHEMHRKKVFSFPMFNDNL